MKKAIALILAASLFIFLSACFGAFMSGGCKDVHHGPGSEEGL